MLLVLGTVICLSCQTGHEATKAERALPASVAPAGEVQRDGSTSPSLPVLRASDYGNSPQQRLSQRCRQGGAQPADKQARSCLNRNIGVFE